MGKKNKEVKIEIDWKKLIIPVASFLIVITAFIVLRIIL